MNATGDDTVSERKLSPVEHSPLAEKVYESLRHAILSGDLLPGDRLVETKIAEEIGVSRAPVREAISRLELEGLVDLRPRRGTYVTTLQKKDVWEVYSLRGALESLAYRLITGNLDENQIAVLQRIADEMKACVETKDKSRLANLDNEFHKTAVELAGHERLLSVWRSIDSQMQLLSQHVIRTEYDDLSLIYQRHQSLLNILRDGSEDEAASAVLEHIQSAAERVLSHLEEET